MAAEIAAHGHPFPTGPAAAAAAAATPARP
jgi:hypothetical protein